MQENQQAPKEQQIVYLPSQYPGTEAEDEIDLLELWNILWQGKWFVIILSLLATLGAVYYSLNVLPVTYKSTAVLQPTDSGSGGSRLAGLAANLPLPINLPGETGKSQNIIDFLKSRNLKKRLIEKYDLLPRLYADKWDPQTRTWTVTDPQERPSLVKALQSNALGQKLQIDQSDESGLITVGWVDEEPAFAERMALRIIEEARYYLENEYETDAQKEREFVERQLEKARQELAYWERQVPSQDLILAEITRERAAAQQVYTELRKQLELAKINEAKEVVRFKILDEPFVPEQRFKPNRGMICALTLVTSGFLAVFLVFFRQFVVNVRQKQQQAKK